MPHSAPLGLLRRRIFLKKPARECCFRKMPGGGDIRLRSSRVAMFPPRALRARAARAFLRPRRGNFLQNCWYFAHTNGETSSIFIRITVFLYCFLLFLYSFFWCSKQFNVPGTLIKNQQGKVMPATARAALHRRSISGGLGFSGVTLA